MPSARRPIKVVIPQDKNYQPVPAGGGPARVFGVVNAEFLQTLDTQVAKVGTAFNAVLSSSSPIAAVAKVTLKKEALAKSHRPFSLFNEKTCPVIGVQGLGELLVSVQREGLANLRSAIRNHTKQNIAAVSTISSITPYRVSEAEEVMASVKEHLGTVSAHSPQPLKVRLFDHRDDALNQRLLSTFMSLVRATEGLAPPVPLDYAPGLRLYKVEVSNPQAIVALSGFAGLQHVSELPGYEVGTQTYYVSQATDLSIPLPDNSIAYPVIGLLDSGTDRDNARLQAWVVGRDEEDIPRGDQDNSHGSFIAGLLINAQGLNHGDPRFPGDRCKIFDAVVFPKSGGTPHSEDLLIASIRRIISKHHTTIKVWNLSISSIRRVCRDDGFSDFAVALDAIQDEFDVTIVTCTGNILAGGHLRSWPCTPGAAGEQDRMFPAADSVRAVTVASVAHQDRHDSIAKSGFPSPFSRRGPGPAFIPKPELSHYGGNCNSTGGFQQTGILSLDATEMIVERVGTSFASPLVAKVLGSLRDTVQQPMSRNLAKALVIQSAVLAGESLSSEELSYRGFGVPSRIEDLLNSPPWQATLIFQPELEPVRRIFELRSFPIPPCFRRPDGTVEGEFVMTLVYDPPLDAGAGAEYCRINVDVSLGTFDLEKDGKRHHHGKVPLEPVDAKTLYESHQLEHGFKWSPTKVYRKRVMRVKGNLWRIFLQMYYRSQDEVGQPQNVALVVTLQDPEKKKDVYNEVVREMTANGWITQDLQLRNQLRLDGQN